LMAQGKIMCEQLPPMHHRLRGNQFQALRPAVTTRLWSINELRYLSFATLMVALLRLRMSILISNKFQFLELRLTSVSARGRSDRCITVVIFLLFLSEGFFLVRFPQCWKEVAKSAH
jgi:hypothetical protein